MLQRIMNYFLRHTQVGIGSLGQLSRSPLASLMTCLVIGITLALPSFLFVILKNAEELSRHFQQTMQLTLYLKKEITEPQVFALKKKLENDISIEEVQTISPTQGLKELQTQEGFESVMKELPTNPLPWTIVILPKTTYHSQQALDTLTQKLKKLPQVDSLQFDMTWIKRLETLVQLAHRTVIALAIFLSFAVFLIINNAIRSATQHNQKAIEIIKLIGGTNAFIRRPFLYAGTIYGLLGGIIAWQLVDLFLLILRKPTTHLAELYQTSFQLIGMGLEDTVVLLGLSIFLGLLGAWIAVAKHL